MGVVLFSMQFQFGVDTVYSVSRQVSRVLQKFDLGQQAGDSIHDEGCRVKENIQHKGYRTDDAGYWILDNYVSSCLALSARDLRQPRKRPL